MELNRFFSSSSEDGRDRGAGGSPGCEKLDREGCSVEKTAMSRWIVRRMESGDMRMSVEEMREMLDNF